MYGLAKTADVAQDWYDNDPEYARLSDKAQQSYSENKEKMRELNEGTDKAQRKGALIGSLAGAATGVGGDLLRVKALGKVPSPYLGMGGAILGGLAGRQMGTAHFDRNNPDLRNSILEASRKNHENQMELFGYMGRKGYIPD